MNVEDIQKLLPHRFPFLMVDRVVEIVPDRLLKAYKNLSANEEFFEGHFPGHPVMPGVLMVEALAQAAALFAFKSMGMSEQQHVVYLMGLDAVRFRRPVTPGDRLDLEVTPLKRKGKIWKMRGEARVDGQLACEAELLATLVDRAAAPGS
ncbi:MAG TPA: 3-hydroxyacyl-ACP dehydratase FabZ [Myxococcales bacterium]|nr:3-hydroxyacyl-ACP dehydratase FabZ [Myxococcales bacterium]